jgi:plastocyanin
VRFMSLRVPALTVPALLSALLLLTVACAPAGSGATGTPAAVGEGGGTATVENGTVAIISNQLKFNVSTIEAPAGEPFTIELTNEEAAPHNVVVFDRQGGEQISENEEPISGPDGTAQYEVPALTAGEYYFECTIHPEMNGTIVVEG